MRHTERKARIALALAQPAGEPPTMSCGCGRPFEHWHGPGGMIPGPAPKSEAEARRRAMAFADRAGRFIAGQEAPPMAEVTVTDRTGTTRSDADLERALAVVDARIMKQGVPLDVELYLEFTVIREALSELLSLRAALAAIREKKAAG